jgi:PAS domain S-box-containing protein
LDARAAEPFPGACETERANAAMDYDRFCRDLVTGAPDAVIYADAEGTIRVWNRGAERIFGYEAGEALGASLDIIIPERLRARHWTGYRETMATGRTRYGAGDLLAVPAVRKDGTPISVEFTIVPVTDEAGTLQGVAAILRDVTARFNELKELRKRAAGSAEAESRPT